MPQVNPYLIFNGTCAEAMRFYERALGGKLTLLKGGESPAAEHLPPGSGDLIIHSALVFDGGQSILAADDIGGSSYQGMKGISVSLGYPTVGEAQKVWDALSDGAQSITMPFGKTFFANAFGMLVDRFGTPWFIGGEFVNM